MALTARGFPKKEYEARWEKLSFAMTRAGLDAALVTSEENFRYFSGFDSQTWVSTTRPRYLVLRRNAEPIAIVPASNAFGVRDRTPITDIRTWNAPNPADEGISMVIAALRDAARSFGAVGAELGPESRLGMPCGDFLRLIDAVRPMEVRDVTKLIGQLRLIKSPIEIERIETIAGIASDCFAALPRLAAGSATSREVAQRISIEALRRGADKTPYVVVECGHGGYENIMMGPDDRPIGHGDIMFVDTGSQYDGYFCDFDRNYSVGVPHDVVSRAHERMFRATEAGLAAIRPGRQARDVWRAVAEIARPSGDSFVGRMGHGLGLSLTEPPSIHPEDQTVLVAGMVLTLEPSTTYPWQGPSGAVSKLMVHEENLVVTESGFRLLSRRAPPEIPLLEHGGAP